MVGGADKSFNQIKDIPNSYLAIDNVEFGRGNKIPNFVIRQTLLHCNYSHNHPQENRSLPHP